VKQTWQFAKDSRSDSRRVKISVWLGIAISKLMTVQKARRGLTTLLVISIVFSPMSSSLAYLFSHQGNLPCYCCTDLGSTCSLRCACGCGHRDASDDQSQGFEALPVSCRQLAFLPPSYALTDRFSLCECIYTEVPTRPPVTSASF
jgi:hypothetical protein